MLIYWHALTEGFKKFLYKRLVVGYYYNANFGCYHINLPAKRFKKIL